MDCGQSHQLRDSRSLHCASDVGTRVTATDGGGRDVGRNGGVGRRTASAIVHLMSDTVIGSRRSGTELDAS